MGTISQKLTYTLEAIDDIQKALEEKGFNMNSVELSKYGSLIRLIAGNPSGGGDIPPDKNNEQILNGLKLDNTYFISKDIQHITQKDIEYNTYFISKDIQHITQKDIEYNTYLFKLDNTYFISKMLTVVDINSVKIKQEE